MLYAAGSGRGLAEYSCSGFLPVIRVLRWILQYTSTCRGRAASASPLPARAGAPEANRWCTSVLGWAHLVDAVQADEHGQGHCDGDEAAQHAHATAHTASHSA